MTSILSRKQCFGIRMCHIAQRTHEDSHLYRLKYFDPSIWMYGESVFSSHVVGSNYWNWQNICYLSNAPFIFSTSIYLLFHVALEFRVVKSQCWSGYSSIKIDERTLTCRYEIFCFEEYCICFDKRVNEDHFDGKHFLC